MSANSIAKNKIVVLLGSSGYVGSAIASCLTSKGISYAGLSRATLDYTDSDVLKQYLETVDAGFLINAAGYTGKPNVDACERDKTNCLFGNAILPGRIAEACRQLHIPWGHISSGCIYTGTKEQRGFAETDAPNFSFRQNNCSFYSGTKALGEEVLAGEKNVYIWRLRIPFNSVDGPRNYLSKLMRYERLLDATNSISELDEFANACVESFSRGIPFGIYNITNPGEITTRKAVELIQEIIPSSKHYSFFSSEEEFMANAAVAPRSNCILDSSKIENHGIRLTRAEDAIVRALECWESATEKAHSC